jgi:hypothetical protein
MHKTVNSTADKLKYFWGDMSSVLGKALCNLIETKHNT